MEIWTKADGYVFEPYTRCNMVMKTCRLIIAALIISATLGCIGITGAAEPPHDHTKTLVLVYLVGSDLESEHGTATTSLNRIAQSYGEADPGNLYVYVAFGGAKTPGWQGMKIASIDQLKDDAKDGKFGNGQYMYSDNRADMGLPQSFSRFLDTAMASRTAERTILVIDDHGVSYQGIGFDENTGHHLLLSDVGSVLQEKQSAFDMIIFDACLMGSLEVAKTVQPYTPVMLGSQETMEGDVNYTMIITTLDKNPGISPVPLGKMLVNSYVLEDPDDTDPLTMSVIDTTRIPDVVASLDQLGAKLVTISEDEDGLHDLKAAYNDAFRMGKGGTSLDLVSLLSNIGKRRPELSPDVKKTIGLVNKAIVYERHNAHVQDVRGISIAIPDAVSPADYAEWEAGLRIAPRWDQFFKTMVTVSHSDTSQSAPNRDGQPNRGVTAREKENLTVIVPARATLSKPRFMTVGNDTVELIDSFGSASVYTIYFRINGQTAQSLGTYPAAPDSTGRYVIPHWDGKWYYFPNTGLTAASLWDRVQYFISAPAKRTEPILTEMDYGGTTVGGSDMYYSGIAFMGEDGFTNATITNFVNTSTGKYESVVTPCYLTPDGIVVYGDSMKKLRPGARILSFTTDFDLNTEMESEAVLSSTTIAPGMSMEYVMLPDGTYATGIMAYYDDDNAVFADQFRIITIRDGTLANSTAGNRLCRNPQ